MKILIKIWDKKFVLLNIKIKKKFFINFAIKLSTILSFVILIIINEYAKMKEKIRQSETKNEINPLSKLTKLIKKKINETNQNILKHQALITNKQNMIQNINPVKI